MQRQLKHIAGLAAYHVGARLADAGSTLSVRFSHHVHGAAPKDALPEVAAGEPAVWIDVGAHRGSVTMGEAERRPNLIVYAFEPNLNVGSAAFARLPNYHVLAMAVSEADGFATLNVNSHDATASLLSVDAEGQLTWKGMGAFRTVATAVVPTIRLDTFMTLQGIGLVQFLKVDAQGHDLAVLRSLGDRIGDVEEILVEARSVERGQYVGAENTVERVRDYLESRGFMLLSEREQSLGNEVNLRFRRDEGGASEAA